MSALASPRPASPRLARGHAWHQSHVALYMKCPRRFFFQHVLQSTPDFSRIGYAPILGTADHGAIAAILLGLKEGRILGREAILQASFAAFDEEVNKVLDRGADLDDEALQRTMDRLEGERLNRLVLLANDPRLHAVEWQGVEQGFGFVERGQRPTGQLYRRAWEGTIDAWGIARTDFLCFGKDGSEWVNVRRGDRILADWKTGSETPLGFAERALNPQFEVYQRALQRRFPGTRWLCFVGQVQDLEPPKAPRDESGVQIPKWLTKRINPDFAEAVAPEDPHKSRKQPRYPDRSRIPKWLPKELNPAFERATSQPRGPFFHLSHPSPAAAEAVQTCAELAEQGAYPATGAVTGQCRSCPFATTCTQGAAQ